ncbi:TPA: hypothetical protein ACSCYS_003377 [Aeromonas veronii]
MVQQHVMATHPEINFNQVINVEGRGEVPLWAVGTIDAEPYSVFYIDGHREDQAQVIFAINKEDQSIHLMSHYIYGHPDSEYDEDAETHVDFYRSAKSVAVDCISSLLNSGVALVSSPQNAEAIKQCQHIPVFYQLDEADEFLREAVLDTLSKDGGVSLLKDSEGENYKIKANYPAPDPTLLSFYTPESPKPEPAQPKSKVETDFGIPF